MGLPEGVFPIVEATLYLATAPKSNTSLAYFKAYKLVEEKGIIEVPKHLKDGNRDAAALGHGEDYTYPHEFPNHHIGQQYLPDNLLGTIFYQPSDQGYETEIEHRLERWRQAQRKALGIEETETLPDLPEREIQTIKRHHTRRGTGDI